MGTESQGSLSCQRDKLCGASCFVQPFSSGYILQSFTSSEETCIISLCLLLSFHQPPLPFWQLTLHILCDKDSNSINLFSQILKYVVSITNIWLNRYFCLGQKNKKNRNPFKGVLKKNYINITSVTQIWQKLWMVVNESLKCDSNNEIKNDVVEMEG